MSAHKQEKWPCDCDALGDTCLMFHSERPSRGQETHLHQGHSKRPLEGPFEGMSGLPKAQRCDWQSYLTLDLYPTSCNFNSCFSCLFWIYFLTPFYLTSTTPLIYLRVREIQCPVSIKLIFSSSGSWLQLESEIQWGGWTARFGNRRGILNHQGGLEWNKTQPSPLKM